MASRRTDRTAPHAEDFWRPLAHCAGYDTALAARLLGISLRSLERLCQRELGCTPSEWLQRERMTRAAELLTAHQPIKAVAAQLGYTLPANFSRDFKRHFGRTPGAFAPQQRLIVPPPHGLRT